MLVRGNPHCNLATELRVNTQEYGKSKIFLPSQAGAKVLSKEEMAEKQAAIKAHQAELQAEREATKAVEQGKQSRLDAVTSKL
jgi:hypothetical protein